MGACKLCAGTGIIAITINSGVDDVCSWREWSFQDCECYKKENQMIQDPNPTNPVKYGEIQFAINGNKVPFPAEMIPKLFVAYVAAMRAEYYAGVDDARNPGCFEQVFHEEIRHAMRDRSEITDWMDNNMDVADESADEIGVTYAKL